MKQIKMVVTDLDHSLLRADKRISEFTLKTIKQAQAQGIKFVPATARPMRKLHALGVKGIFPYDAFVTTNGSKIFLNEEKVYQTGISPEELAAFLPTLLKHYGNTRISIEIDDCIYVNHNVHEVDPDESSFILTDFSDLPQLVSDRIILEMPNPDEIQNLQRILPDYLYAHAVSDSPICRILHTNVSKAYAIDYLAKYWNIEPDEIVCFGDDANDLEMFAYCGTAVAVANAIPEVLEAATAYTLSNEADGVATWIQHNILT